MRVGSVVEDHSGRFTGIVMGVSKEYPGQLQVRYWDSEFKLYIPYLKHKNYLRLALDPSKVERICREDPEFQRILREEVTDLALATHDQVWFEQLMKGGIKDEIEDI